MEHTPRKTLLHCPACGHESPPDGDWCIRPDHERERLSCPDCFETITVRGVSGLAA
ncbi:MAG: hypothetical protein V5A31_08420 [Haloferacaceae archaeon]|jgi:predicted RNA-binding Zn-ribbon protein involved in translation (DUF1610 family)